MVRTTTTRRRKQTKPRRLFPPKVESFVSAVSKIKRTIKQKRPKTNDEAIRIALNAAKNLKGQLQNSSGRVIKIPKVGGILPLIPIFAALSAMGSLGGAAAGVAKAINSAKAAKKQLEEANRHNRTMESIAMGKGLFLRPYQSGLGIFLRPPPQMSGAGVRGGCYRRRRK